MQKIIFTDLQLDKANSFDTPNEAPILSITNGIVSNKLYDKQDDINFCDHLFLQYVFCVLLLFVLSCFLLWKLVYSIILHEKNHTMTSSFLTSRGI